MREWTPGDDISLYQIEEATQLRVPFLTNPFPQWDYLTGVVIESGLGPWAGKMPNEGELKLIGDWLEAYNLHWYGQPGYGYRKTMEDFAPYDIDGGANLGYLLKRDDHDWCYRKKTWNRGPTMWPLRGEPEWVLEDLLEKIQPNWHERLKKGRESG